MLIQVAVAKVSKYASSESGDTLEMIERPQGGLSFVLADGQRSGRSAKAISNLVTSKAISLLAEGIRDGAAARATHDYLYNQRGGRVSATLNILSIDMVTKTLVLSRNSHCPAIIQTGPGVQIVLDEPAAPLGVQRQNKPHIKEMPLSTGMLAVVYTDGIHSAGENQPEGPLDVIGFVDSLYTRYMGCEEAARQIADTLLEEALRRDQGRPQDDMSLLVMAILPREGGEVRRMTVTLPVPPLLRP